MHLVILNLQKTIFLIFLCLKSSDFSKNLMVAAAGKEMSLPSEIYNNIGITNQFKIN